MYYKKKIYRPFIEPDVKWAHHKHSGSDSCLKPVLLKQALKIQQVIWWLRTENRMLCPTCVSEAFIGCSPLPSSWILFARHATKNSMNKAKQACSIPEGFPNLNIKYASYDESGKLHMSIERAVIDQDNEKPNASKLNRIRYSFINYLHLTTTRHKNILKLWVWVNGISSMDNLFKCYALLRLLRKL